MIKLHEFTSLSSTVRDLVRPKNFRAPLLAGGLLLLTSCSTPRTSGEPWVYAMSRSFYPAVCDDGEFFSAFAQDAMTECAALVVIVVFALPFAIDTVLLPVTVPHDLWLVD